MKVIFAMLASVALAAPSHGNHTGQSGLSKRQDLWVDSDHNGIDDMDDAFITWKNAEMVAQKEQPVVDKNHDGKDDTLAKLEEQLDEAYRVDDMRKLMNQSASSKDGNAALGPVVPYILDDGPVVVQGQANRDMANEQTKAHAEGSGRAAKPLTLIHSLDVVRHSLEEWSREQEHLKWEDKSLLRGWLGEQWSKHDSRRGHLFVVSDENPNYVHFINTPWRFLYPYQLRKALERRGLRVIDGSKRRMWDPVFYINMIGAYRGRVESSWSEHLPNQLAEEEARPGSVMYEDRDVRDAWANIAASMICTYPWLEVSTIVLCSLTLLAATMPFMLAACRRNKRPALDYWARRQCHVHRERLAGEELDNLPPRSKT